MDADADGDVDLADHSRGGRWYLHHGFVRFQFKQCLVFFDGVTYGDQDRRQEDAHLAQHAIADQVDGEDLRAETGQLIGALVIIPGLVSLLQPKFAVARAAAARRDERVLEAEGA